MAKSYKGNPWVVGGTVGEEENFNPANTQTWKAGQWFVQNNGYVSLCASAAVKVTGMFTKDQTTNSAVGTLVKGVRFREGTILEGYICNGDADTPAVQAYAGEDYGIHVGGNTVSIDKADPTNVAVTVEDIGANYDVYRQTVATDPGTVRFRIKAAILTAS